MSIRIVQSQLIQEIETLPDTSEVKGQLYQALDLSGRCLTKEELISAIQERLRDWQKARRRCVGISTLGFRTAIAIVVKDPAPF